MVEQVTAFKTRDGQVFQDESEALRHELLLDLRDCFEDDIADGQANFNAAIEWFAANLTTLVEALGRGQFVHKQELAKIYKAYLERPEATINETETISELTRTLGVKLDNLILEEQSEV